MMLKFANEALDRLEKDPSRASIEIPIIRNALSQISDEMDALNELIDESRPITENDEKLYDA